LKTSSNKNEEENRREKINKRQTSAAGSNKYQQTTLYL